MRMPDGSAVTLASGSLPSEHWYKQPAPVPPAPYRGAANLAAHAAHQYSALLWGLSGATMGFKDCNFDPDALVQNYLVGALGYFTPTGHVFENHGVESPAPYRVGMGPTRDVLVRELTGAVRYAIVMSKDCEPFNDDTKHAGERRAVLVGYSYILMRHLITGLWGQ